MLFSRDDVASFINNSFEPVWESVRPVPTVRIDFGNGSVITRTLHGNIATYVCGKDGDVIDILPGIYDPPTYLKRLQQLRLLAHLVATLEPEKKAAWLRHYHKGQAEAVAKNAAPPQPIKRPDLTKSEIEGSAQKVLASSKEHSDRAAAKALSYTPSLDSREDLASWKELADDSRQNDAVRRRQIHDMLAGKTSVRPQVVTKWLYKEVLHADLDDPYLGLGKLLFADYPFAKEDGTTGK